MPSLTPIKVYRGTPTAILMPGGSISSVTDAYTVPAGKRFILKTVRVTNIDEDNRLQSVVYLKTGTTISASDGDYVLYAVQVEFGDVFLFETSEILEAGEKIFVWIDQLGPAAVQISGIEVTL